MEQLTLETFQPHAGSTFQLIIDEQPVLDLVLAEVEDLSRPNRSRRQDDRVRTSPFSLIFHGPLSPVANQQSFDLQHEQLGRLNIFLVPVGPDTSREKMCYQAIFN